MARRETESEKSMIEDLEFELDMVTGRKSKRPKMAVLNKKKLSQQELDELFCEDDVDIEFD
jgi:hypothetical protein